MSGAEVVLTLADGTMLETTSDAAGAFRFAELPEGVHRLTVLGRGLRRPHGRDHRRERRRGPDPHPPRTRLRRTGHRDRTAAGAVPREEGTDERRGRLGRRTRHPGPPGSLRAHRGDPECGRLLRGARVLDPRDGPARVRPRGRPAPERLGGWSDDPGLPGRLLRPVQAPGTSTRSRSFGGPQSTQQGRNALAGAIVMRSADPHYETEIRARARVSGADTVHGSATVNVPARSRESRAPGLGWTGSGATASSTTRPGAKTPTTSARPSPSGRSSASIRRPGSAAS